MATAAINIDGAGRITERAGNATHISVVRIDVGLYRIYGAISLDVSRWSVSVPHDISGNAVVQVEQIDDDAALCFCVRDQQFTPVDIPPGKVISLRLTV